MHDVCVVGDWQWFDNSTAHKHNIKYFGPRLLKTTKIISNKPDLVLKLMVMAPNKLGEKYLTILLCAAIY